MVTGLGAEPWLADNRGICRSIFSLILCYCIEQVKQSEINNKQVLVFPWDQRGLLLLGFPNLLVGDVYHVKNEGCLLEFF